MSVFLLCQFNMPYQDRRMPSDKERFPKGGGSEATIVTEAIINYAVTRMAFSVRKFVLKKEISIILYGEEEKDGQPTGQPVKLMSIMSYERIRKKAREVLHLRSVEGSKVARQESIGFYENIIADPDVSNSSRIKARENLDKIHSVVTAENIIIPLTGSTSHQVVDLDSLDLTIEQKKKLLETHRAGNNNSKQSSSQ